VPILLRFGDAIGGGFLGGLSVRTIIEDQVETEAGELKSDPPPDAARCAGNQTHLLHSGGDDMEEEWRVEMKNARMGRLP